MNPQMKSFECFECFLNACSNKVNSRLCLYDLGMPKMEFCVNPCIYASYVKETNSKIRWSYILLL